MQFWQFVYKKNEMKSFVAFLIFSLTTKCTADSIQQPSI